MAGPLSREASLEAKLEPVPPLQGAFFHWRNLLVGLGEHVRRDIVYSNLIDVRVS
jgi:hypothetical protein